MAKAIIQAGWVEKCGHIICGHSGPGTNLWELEKIACRYCDPDAGEPYPADLIRIAWKEQQ